MGGGLLQDKISLIWDIQPVKQQKHLNSKCGSCCNSRSINSSKGGEGIVAAAAVVATVVVVVVGGGGGCGGGDGGGGGDEDDDDDDDDVFVAVVVTANRKVTSLQDLNLHFHGDQAGSE